MHRVITTFTFCQPFTTRRSTRRGYSHTSYNTKRRARSPRSRPTQKAERFGPVGRPSGAVRANCQAVIGAGEEWRGTFQSRGGHSPLASGPLGHVVGGRKGDSEDAFRSRRGRRRVSQKRPSTPQHNVIVPIASCCFIPLLRRAGPSKHPTDQLNYAAIRSCRSVTYVVL